MLPIDEVEWRVMMVGSESCGGEKNRDVALVSLRQTLVLAHTVIINHTVAVFI